jgi:hypothetical protein
MMRVFDDEIFDDDEFLTDQSITIVQSAAALTNQTHDFRDVLPIIF